MPSLRLLLALSFLTLVTSCRGPSYRIQLRDGREITATTQPSFQSKTGYYRYRNTVGKDALLLREEVLMIEEI
jgi:hypothetical protein